MHHGEDAMMLVRGELCDRLDALRNATQRLSARDFALRVDGMRSLAAAYGLTPVVRLTEALERAVGKSGHDLRCCPTALYLTRLQDAIGCDRLDDAASEALLASVSVRL
ncbi:MAG TPA: hypothetical protein VGB48_04895 [Allosphingosinicella sp.]|jgi:hypothetical protein